MAFKDIVGNNRVKKILSTSLRKQRLPNSLLFSGPEGVGKKHVALVVAKALNCLQNAEDSCDACSSCRAVNSNRFPDVMVVSPDKDKIKIEQMRLLKQTAHLKPLAGKKKVFLIEEAEKMNDEAANSLLKVLEEPPFSSHIILLTSNIDRIIPTVKSRCQILTFAGVSKEDIENSLVEKGYDNKKAHMISLLVKGNLKQALDTEWDDVQIQKKQAWQVLMSLIKGNKISQVWGNSVTSRILDRKGLEQMMELFASFIRDILLINEKGNLHMMMNPEYAEQLRKTAPLLSHEKAFLILSRIDYANFALQRNLNINLLRDSFFYDFLGWEYE